MKVAFVNQPYDRVMPPDQNSVGLVTYHTARALAQDVRVSVYVGGAPPAGSPPEPAFGLRRIAAPWDDRLHALVRDHPRWAKRLHLDWLRDVHPQYARRVGASLERTGADVAHVMNYWPWSRRIRGRGSRPKVVLEMHAEWLSQMDRRAVTSQLRSVDAVLGVSEHITSDFRRSFPGYPGITGTSYNGVDTETFRPRREGTPGPGTEPRVLFVGRVSPEKGVHTLLEAFARVVERTPGARLDLVGNRTTLPPGALVELSDDPRVRALGRFYDGTVATDYQRHLDRTVARLGLEGSVRFLGGAAHDEVAEWYRAADLVVNAALSESFGMAMLEGMASGVAVVGTRVGGMRETVVHDETGLLVEPERPEELARAISTLLADRELRSRMAAAGRRRAVEQFSWQARARRLLDVYQAVVPSEPAS